MGPSPAPSAMSIRSFVTTSDRHDVGAFANGVARPENVHWQIRPSELATATSDSPHVSSVQRPGSDVIDDTVRGVPYVCLPYWYAP